MTGYEAYSGDEQNGNFLAIHVDAPEGATITGELVGGVHGPVTLDESRVIIFRITDKTTQKVKFVASQYGDSTEYVYDLSGLTLNQS